MERNYLICMLIGEFVATKGQSVKTGELKEFIDESLLKCCFTPLGTEPNDNQFLDEVIGETMMFVIGQGINRRQRRG